MQIIPQSQSPILDRGEHSRKYLHLFQLCLLHFENGGPDCVPDEYSLVSYGPYKLHFLYPSCLTNIVSAFMETEENKGQRHKNSVLRQPK